MASPQIENGFTKVSNELLEALATVKMSGTEWQFVMCLIRKTYGYSKSEDWITNSQIAEMMCSRKERVSEAKAKLIERNIVTEKRNLLSLNKDYEKWVELRKTVTIVTEKRIKLLRKSVPTKEKKEKRNITEQSSEELKSNQEKDMGWNKHGDDFEEELQIDPDYQPVKKKKEKTVPDNIQAVFDLFPNPAKVTWRMREIERVAAQTLFDTYGLETLKKRIDRIEREKKNKDVMFPLAVTPSQLLDKMPNIERYFGI